MPQTEQTTTAFSALAPHRNLALLTLMADSVARDVQDRLSNIGVALMDVRLSAADAHLRAELDELSELIAGAGEELDALLLASAPMAADDIMRLATSLPGEG